jgi:hypothetical protein
LPLPTTPEFEAAYAAFTARYGFAQGSGAQSLEFVENLRQLLEMAVRCAGAAPGESATGAAQIGIETIPTELHEMLRLNAGWIDRIKQEEAMEGVVPWPART